MDEKSNVTPDSSANDANQVASPSSTGNEIERFVHKHKASTILIFLASIVIVLSLMSFFFLENKTSLTSSRPKTLSERIIDLNNESFRDASTGGALSQGDLNKSYLEPLREAETYTDENPIREKFTKFISYKTVYNQLVTQYYATHDQKILGLAKELKGLIKKDFSEYYASNEKDYEKVWEIVE